MSMYFMQTSFSVGHLTRKTQNINYHSNTDGKNGDYHQTAQVILQFTSLT